MHAAGINGSGIAVAVLDTGVDKNHPYLNGAVVSEACYSTNDSAEHASSVCPGGVASSTEAGSAMPYGGNCLPGRCDHGTHVAGTIAGRTEVPGSPGPGVAPQSDIIAIQVFTRFDVEFDGEQSSGVGAFTSDMMKGLERVYELRNTYKIASVNMSIGGGGYNSYCDDEDLKTQIDNLRSARIATVIASGNEGSCVLNSHPSCISSAISVGATDSNDAVARFSNSATFLNLFAPGVSITSSTPNNGWDTWRGTSMAPPPAWREHGRS